MQFNIQRREIDHCRVVLGTAVENRKEKEKLVKCDG